MYLEDKEVASETPSEVREEYSKYESKLDTTSGELEVVKITEFAQDLVGKGLGAYDRGLEKTYVIPGDIFREDWIRPKKVKIFEVKGNSMHPRLEEKSLAFLDIEDREIEAGCIYLVQQLGKIHVTRVNRLDAERLELIPENKDYSKITLDSKDGEIEVIGRVFYTCRRV